jgi:hypothetical protein
MVDENKDHGLRHNIKLFLKDPLHEEEQDDGKFLPHPLIYTNKV